MKTIVIMSQGFISSKGVYGPVLTPYEETLTNISDMIARNIEVYEVLDNGNRVRLSFSDLSNVEVTDTVPVEKPQTIKPSTKPSIVVKPCMANHSHSKNTRNKKKNKDSQSSFTVDCFEEK